MKAMKAFLFVCVIVLEFVVLSGGDSLAQDSRTTTVMGRERAEFNASGIRSGSFVIKPALGVWGSHDDNIFASATNERSAYLYQLRPEVSANSDWNQHQLTLFSQGRIVRHVDNGKEDFDAYTIRSSGRIDVRRDTQITANLSFREDYEDRSSPDDVGGIEPTNYRVVDGGLGVENRWNRVSIKFDFGYSGKDYDDVPTSGGVPVNNDDRDREDYSISLRANYEIQPSYTAFLEGSVTSVNYDAARDDAGVNRDSDGYGVRVGTRVDVTGLIFGDLFLGYQEREYEAATLAAQRTYDVGLDLTWNITGLTTIVGGVTRNISETTVNNASGNLQTDIKGSVDHELLYNLIAHGRLGFIKEEYKGISRQDDTVRAGVGATYLVNRHIRVNLDYDFSEKSSTVAASEYQNNVVALKVRLQM